MSNHSDGVPVDGRLVLTDSERKRITGGITLSLQRPFISDIRINYEKYFYPENALIHVSEQDKFVIEFMTRFYFRSDITYLSFVRWGCGQ